MEKVTKPNVTALATGEKYVAKQMMAKGGDLLPEHTANLESVVFVHEGECTIHIGGQDKSLKMGEAFIVPPDTKHQIKAETDFKGIHFMPEEIKFEFFN